MIPSRTGFAKGKLVSGSAVIMTGENFTFITGSIFNVPLQTKTAFLGPLTIKERLLVIIVTVFSGKGENSHLDAINCLLHVCIRISKYQKRSHTIRSDRQDLNKPSCQLFSQLNVIGDFSVSLRITRKVATQAAACGKARWLSGYGEMPNFPKQRIRQLHKNCIPAK